MKKFRLIMTLILICTWQIILAQKTITGTVTDSKDGSTLPGVSVILKGTSTAAITDVDGAFKIQIPATGGTLVFSFVGYTAREIAVGNQSTVDVKLTRSVEELQEVVVTALGVSKEKKSLGYAMTEVGGRNVSDVKELNVINSLSGRVAGVVITPGTFGPGSSSRVIIRGNNSITGNNEPLYVVDGIPIDNSGYGSANSTNGAEYSKTDYGTGISDINPDDVESISILKGPNAAALYGSRAANGVILITTKKGTLNKGLGVTYSANVTMESPMILPKFQNVYGQGSGGNTPTTLGELRNNAGSWGTKMDGSSKIYWNGDTKPFSPQPNNVKDFFRTGVTGVNSLAFEGGTQHSSFRFSYTNTAAKSILPGSKLQRHNFNLRSVSNLTDRLTVDTKITYFVQEGTNRPTLGTEGVMRYLYPIPRNTVISDLKDFQNPDYTVKSWANGSYGNPYWFMLYDKNNDSRSSMQGFVKATYKFTDYLSAFVRAGTDVVNEKIENLQHYGHWFYATGRMNNSLQKNSESNIDALIMFNKSLTPQLKLDVNAGANYRYQTYEAMSIYAEKFKIPTVPTLASAATNLPSYTPLQEKIVNSAYGSAQLSYKDFLYLEGSARNDWSSTLPKNNWSYFYPSVSLSVLLQDIIGFKTMNFAKVRASLALVGNDTGPYQLQNAFNISASGDSYLGLTILTRPDTRNNPDLKPEQVQSLEFGGEFRFLDNRIYTDISYYSIKSKNLIMNVPIPAATGYSNEHTNVGEMQNKGFEILLGGVPVQQNDFKWDISLNFAANKNKLNKLIAGTDRFIFSTTNDGAIEVVAKVGQGFGDIWATTYQRDDNGNIIVDAQGRYQVAPDKKFVGNYQPKWTAGLSNSLTYKDITLRFLIDARYGGVLYSGTDAQMDNAGVTDRTLQYRESGVVVKGVTSAGAANTTKITADQYWGSISGIAENYIYKQDNIRLREVSLMYNFTSKLLGKSFIKGASIGLTGRNILFLHKVLENFDPEGSFSTSSYAQGMLFYNMPTTRSIGFNLNVKF